MVRGPEWRLPLSTHGHWRRGANGRELIPVVAIQGLEPFRKVDAGGATPVESDVAGVNVHHLGRLHRSVVEVFIRRVERVIDPEIFDPRDNYPCDQEICIDVDVASTEEPGVAVARGST